MSKTKTRILANLLRSHLAERDRSELRQTKFQSSVSSGSSWCFQEFCIIMRTYRVHECSWAGIAELHAKREVDQISRPKSQLVLQSLHLSTIDNRQDRCPWPPPPQRVALEPFQLCRAFCGSQVMAFLNSRRAIPSVFKPVAVLQASTTRTTNTTMFCYKLAVRLILSQQHSGCLKVPRRNWNLSTSTYWSQEARFSHELTKPKNC